MASGAVRHAGRMTRPRRLLAALVVSATAAWRVRRRPRDDRPAGVDGLEIPTPVRRPGRLRRRIDNPSCRCAGQRLGLRRHAASTAETITVTVTDQTRVVAGRDHDRRPRRGHRRGRRGRVEDTYDWYAQDTAGNVWYFGEDTTGTTRRTSDRGLVGGRRRRRPGRAGDAGRARGSATATSRSSHQGVAEDRARCSRSTSRSTSPAGSFADVLQTEDDHPLEPGVVERKYYARGIGLVERGHRRPRARRTVELRRSSSHRPLVADWLGPVRGAAASAPGPAVRQALLGRLAGGCSAGGAWAGRACRWAGLLRAGAGADCCGAAPSGAACCWPAAAVAAAATAARRWGLLRPLLVPLLLVLVGGAVAGHGAGGGPAEAAGPEPATGSAPWPKSSGVGEAGERAAEQRRQDEQPELDDRVGAGEERRRRSSGPGSPRCRWRRSRRSGSSSAPGRSPAGASAGCSLRLSVTARMTSRKTNVISASSRNAAHQA